MIVAPNARPGGVRRNTNGSIGPIHVVGGRAANSMREMRAIFEAIMAHDPKTACTAIRTHVLKARAAVKEAMAKGV